MPPDSMSSVKVRFKGGEPGASSITPAALLVESAKLVTTDMSGFAIPVIVWLPVWDAAVVFKPILPSVLAGGMKARVPPVGASREP